MRLFKLEISNTEKMESPYQIADKNKKPNKKDKIIFLICAVKNRFAEKTRNASKLVLNLFKYITSYNMFCYWTIFLPARTHLNVL